MAGESRKRSAEVKEAMRKLKCKLALNLLEEETPFQETLAKVMNAESSDEASLESDNEDGESTVGVEIRATGNADNAGKYDQPVTETLEIEDTAILLDELDMEPQGLPGDDVGGDEADTAGDDLDSTCLMAEDNSDISSQESIIFQGVTFRKRRCYRRDDGKMYAIKYFASQEEAWIVRVYPFHDTFVGGLTSRSHPKGLKYVQVPQKSRKIHLKHLVSLSDAEEIEFPDWACCPRKGRSFAYWNTAKKMCCGKRDKIFGVDLYANVGGFSAGMSKAGIHTTIGVEKETIPITAFAVNHNPGIKEGDLDDFIGDCRESVYFLACRLRIEGKTAVFNGTVKEFLVKYKENRAFRFALGVIHYVHLSPPCQGFSFENRNGGQNDLANNSEVLMIILVAEILRPLAISLEEVTGIWRQKNKTFITDYLAKIYLGLLDHGYQFRQFCAQACHFGDGQKRPRFFILASLAHIPLPNVPRATHGPPGKDGNARDPTLLPFVTGPDVLAKFERRFPVQPADKTVGDDVYYLKRNEPAPAIRASKAPRHYSEHRLLHWREARALTFRDSNFVVLGSDEEKLRQIGNAVPIGLATAICKEIELVLQYEYLVPGTKKDVGVDPAKSIKDRVCDLICYLVANPVAYRVVNDTESIHG